METDKIRPEGVYASYIDYAGYPLVKIELVKGDTTVTEIVCSEPEARRLADLLTQMLGKSEGVL